MTSARAAVPVIVLDGTGWGHGVGLSQWGAEYLARTGRSADQILATFYPGAAIGQAAGSVRVAVHQAPASTTTLTFPQGGEVRSPLEGAQSPGFPVRVNPGERVRITYDGAYRVDALMTARAAGTATSYRQDPCALLTVCTTPTTTVPATSTSTTSTTAPPKSGGSGGSGGGSGTGGGTGGSGTASPPSAAGASSSGPVWAVPAAGGATTVDDRGRSYRGTIQATGGGALRLVNVLGVEDYLRGMAEVPGGWPASAVQAQSVAARTYALRAMQSGGELCDDARCQVYVGRTAESAGQDAAVWATAGRVLRYEGALAAAVYSADAGGVSATTLEGFGTPDGVYPYLTTVRYDTDNPLPWHLELALGDVAGRLGYRGTLTGLRVGSTGPSGRALDLVLEGTAGEVKVDGITFARSLGLRSTRFTARMGSSDGAPPPPPPAAEGAIQALPDEATSVVEQSHRPLSSWRFDRRPMAPPTLAEAVHDALDPRRRLTALLAMTTLAALVGACIPMLLARPQLASEVVSRVRTARPWARWRLLIRDR
ncbi:MAG: SpoIID/LytB domain-containing protein [Microthrixaceae bacterium]